MSSRWAVICGLVRDEAALAVKLDTLAEWRRQGVIDGVVLSTWAGEKERYSIVSEKLASGAFTLVEMDQPRLKAPGHVIHQMKTLHYGLQAVPADAWVLKLRPDLGPISDIVRESILDPGLEPDGDDQWPDVFSSKILTPSAFLDQPYYINDIIYYGRRRDLQKLANFDLSTEYACTSTAPEQFFYRGAFAGRIPLFEAALQVLPHFAYNDEAGAARRLAALLGSDFFLDVFALNLLFLKKYFRLGFAPAGSRTPLDQPLSIADLFSATATIPDVAYNRGAVAPALQGERALDALLSGHVVPDELGMRFAAALERVRDPAYRDGFEANALTPHPAVRALARAVWDALPGMPRRLDEREDPDGRHFFIGGHHDRVSMASDDDHTRRLEEEINHLRRRIDEINQTKK